MAYVESVPSSPHPSRGVLHHEIWGGRQFHSYASEIKSAEPSAYVVPELSTVLHILNGGERPVVTSKNVEGIQNARQFLEASFFPGLDPAAEGSAEKLTRMYEIEQSVQNVLAGNPDPIAEKLRSSSEASR